MLFAHGDFGNEKELVQQIGRVVRRRQPQGTRDDATAFVYVRPQSGSPAAFSAYRAYEKAAQQKGRPLVLDSEEYGRKLRELGVLAEYSGRRYRLAPPADLDKSGGTTEEERARQAAVAALIADVRPQRRVVVFDVGGAFDFSAWSKRVTAAIERDDRDVIAEGVPSPDRQLHVVVSHIVETSDLFERTALLENRYAATVSYLYDGRLYVYDSSGGSQTEAPAPASSVGQLVPEQDDTLIRSVALASLDPGANAVRSSVFSGRSLANAPPAISDLMNSVSRATARVTDISGDRVSRYVGFANGRVSDARPGHISLGEFATWCEGLGRELNAPARRAGYFDRYGRPVTPPAPVVPVLLMLDVDRLNVDFAKQVGGREIGLMLDDYSVLPTPDATSADFHLKFGGLEEGQPVTYAATITYDAARERFRFESPDLREFVGKSDIGRDIVLESAIDRQQAMRMLLDPPPFGYVDGKFVEFSTRSEAMKGVLNDLLFSDPDLIARTSEKGSAGDGVHWDPTSLFDLIDRRNGRFPTVPDLDRDWMLVCDDMGTELADFIAVDPGPEPAIAFIHCKRKRIVSTVSASGLHDVLAQATKNLDFLRLGGSPIPAARRLTWGKTWTAGPQYVVASRLRGLNPPPSSEAAFNLVADVLANAATRRFVVAVVSGSIDRAELLRAVAAPLATRSPEATQAYFQLLAFHGAVGQGTAKPVVVCD